MKLDTIFCLGSQEEPRLLKEAYLDRLIAEDIVDYNKNKIYLDYNQHQWILHYKDIN